MGTSKNSFSTAAGCKGASAASPLLAVTHCCYDLSGLLAAVLFARSRDKNELLEVPDSSSSRFVE